MGWKFELRMGTFIAALRDGNSKPADNDQYLNARGMGEVDHDLTCLRRTTINIWLVLGS
jgi:hypothetical protein